MGTRASVGDTRGGVGEEGTALQGEGNAVRGMVWEGIAEARWRGHWSGRHGGGGHSRGSVGESISWGSMGGEVIALGWHWIGRHWDGGGWHGIGRALHWEALGGMVGEGTALRGILGEGIALGGIGLGGIVKHRLGRALHWEAWWGEGIALGGRLMG